MSIISLSLPKDLLEKLDSIRGDDRGASRSEIIRQAVCLYVSEYCQLDEIIGKIIAAVTVLYETTEKNDELFHLQHEFGDMITAYLHSHLTGGECLEVMVVKGSAQRLKSLSMG